MRYEWRGTQLWDDERKCWIIWDTVGGVIGATDELKAQIADFLNAKSIHDMSAELLVEIDKTLRDSGLWVGGRLDSIKHLVETVTKIESLLVATIGRTPNKSLVADAANLAARVVGDEAVANWLGG